MNTYNDIYLNVRRKLRASGVQSPDLEARLIVAYAAGKTREELMNASRYYVTDTAILKAVDEFLERRLAGEPVAYITGEWEFYSLPMVVNESVMIPRIDSETLAHEAIRLLQRRAWPTRMLDLCAGSGCIGLAVAANLPNCRVVLADVCENALAVCRANMLRNNVSRHVTAIEVDVLETPPALLGTFDLIVSNPPYIPTDEIKDLDVSVRDYEPKIALDGGPDGLYYIRAIATNWSSLLKQGGHLAFECAEGQASAVREILDDCGFRGIKTYLDTLEIERAVVGTLR